MSMNTLQKSVGAISASWRSLDTDLVESCQRHLRELLDASPTEDWLADLHRDRPGNRELYRDTEHGFVLLAHAEQAGLYRPPHDHGRSWVIYAVQQGEIEMGTFARVEAPDGSMKLVKRNSTVVRAGELQVYLPGDIHDTRCLSPTALLFRFTERDLKKEDKVEHRVTRYAKSNGIWIPGAL
jgi:hypothetical protein